MSLLFFEREEENDIMNTNTTNTECRLGNSNNSLPSKDYLVNMFSSVTISGKTTPKVQSNLLLADRRDQDRLMMDRKSNDELDELTTTSTAHRDKLVQCISDKEAYLTSVRNEYDKQYDGYFALVRKFYTEKLNNLKLTFKNQILKQKIYFESELAELNKDYERDFTGRNGKHLLKMFKSDLKTLLEYMRESLLNSGDTLIETYETCEVIKKLELTQGSFTRTNVQLKASSQVNRPHDDDTAEQQQQSTTMTDEQRQIDQYKHDLDELMHTLDDIELQHLQRKELLNTKTKFVQKLKSKFKFIENKYDTLNRQVSNLKFESYVYRQLWQEKQLLDKQKQTWVI